MLGICAVGIVGISVAAIWLATTKNRGETTKLVFVSVLPLFGTWVGTVLAYYFAGKNLAAATASTAALSDVTRRLAGVMSKTTTVRDKMIPWERMRALDLSEEQEQNLNSLALKTIWDKFTEIGFDRLPLVGPKRTVRAVVHRSLLDSYAATTGIALPDGLTDAMTIASLTADQQRLLKAFAIVTASATLGEARDRMRAVPDCKDVFVTETGKETDPVVGWLTNSDLAAISE